MTTYNDAKYIKESIESVVAQSFQDWELIIWNDGSTDETLSIARNFQDNRIRVFDSKHLGRTKLLIRASEQISSASKFVGFVDSDDALLPNALEECFNILEDNSLCGMVYTDYLKVSETGSNLGVADRCSIPYSKENLLLDLVTFHFRLIKTEVFNQVGGIDPSFDYAEDYDLCLKISEVTNVIHLRKALYRYRINPKGITRTKHNELMRYSLIAVNNALERRGDKRRVTLGNGRFYLERALKIG